MDILIVDYFQSLFTTTDQTGPMEFLKPLEGWISDLMNMDLARDFTREEIFNTLQQMQPLKAPGPNGMSPLFFQRY